jgi:hypothetical protein
MMMMMMMMMMMIIDPGVTPFTNTSVASPGGSTSPDDINLVWSWH